MPFWQNLPHQYYALVYVHGFGLRLFVMRIQTKLILNQTSMMGVRLFVIRIRTNIILIQTPMMGVRLLVILIQTNIMGV